MVLPPRRDVRAARPDVPAFFGLVALFSMPLYLLSMLAGMNILGSPDLAALYITIVTLVPALAASILCRGRLRDLYARSFRLRRDMNVWYGISVLLASSLALLTYEIVSLRQPELPPPMVPATSPLAFLAACLFFFILASAEEVGWMGYAFDSMQSRRGTVPAALLLGTFWALWHVPFLLVLFPDPKVSVGAEVLTLVAFRVLCCWIYNSAEGSTLAVILFHATDNIAYLSLPQIRSDLPRGPVTMCLVTIVAAVLVAGVCGVSSH